MICDHVLSLRVKGSSRFLRQQIEKVVNKANSEKRKRAVVRTQRRQTNNKKVSDRYSAFVSI